MDLPSDQQPWSVLTGKACPYCGGQTRFCDSAEVYARSYGMIYFCKPCDAWVGCHKGGANRGQALGRLANKELRKWKQTAHAQFDAIWKIKPGSGPSAYAWLAQQMGLPSERTHIGMFNMYQCREVVRICDEPVARVRAGKETPRSVARPL